jgi:hypothetical protein
MRFMTSVLEGWLLNGQVRTVYKYINTDIFVYNTVCIPHT